MPVVAAVDCGATSVRVCRIDLDATPLTPEVIHRVAHTPYRDEVGHLRWDWTRIISAVIDGLERCFELGPLASIGVDTWAVDYGLLDETNELISAPYSYRDHRTDGYRTIVDDFGADAMYRINGLQLQPFNTVFQVAAHDPEELARAVRLLWLPELIVHALSGVAITERTSAGSSGLLDLATGNWSPELLGIAGIDQWLVGQIESAGRVVADWRGVPISLVGGHDTASAVAGMGRRSAGGSAFVASGTWMLVGVERFAADTSKWAQERNFTNEARVLVGFRFLRNVTGFWLLEQCRLQWGYEPIETLVAAAEREKQCSVPIVDVDHVALRAPEDMLTAYTSLAGLQRDANPGVVTRSIIESVARRTSEVISQLQEVETFDNLVLSGGAARIELLAQRLRELTGLTVGVGSPEAAVLGNAIVQGIAIGKFASIEEGSIQL